MMESYWKKCSNCKKEIAFRSDYYKCSVSTCNHERTGLQFCSVSCWSAHVPIYRHRDAWALEDKAPASGPTLIRVDPNVPKVAASSSTPVTAPSAAAAAASIDDTEVLVVASKLKAFIKAQADMNTSADVMEVLSSLLRRQALDAVQRARADGRKTVMGRDFVRS